MLEVLPAAEAADVDAAKAEAVVGAHVLHECIERRIGEAGVVVGGRVLEGDDAFGAKRVQADPALEVLKDVALQVHRVRPWPRLALDDGAEDDQQVGLRFHLLRRRARAVVGEDRDELARVLGGHRPGDLVVEPDDRVGDTALLGIHRFAVIAFAEAYDITVVDRVVVLVRIAGDPLEDLVGHAREQFGVRQAVLLHRGLRDCAVSRR